MYDYFQSYRIKNVIREKVYEKMRNSERERKQAGKRENQAQQKKKECHRGEASAKRSRMKNC